MNVFELRDRLVSDYEDFTRSVVETRDPTMRDLVLDEATASPRIHPPTSRKCPASVVIRDVVTVAASGLTIKASKRFMADVRSLQADIVKKVDRVVQMLLDHGTHYPGLETRKIAGNPDGRFRLMDVDYSHRIVAAIEGDRVFLEKVGPHDPTERWGETATLREYEQRLDVGRTTFKPKPVGPPRAPRRCSTSARASRKSTSRAPPPTSSPTACPASSRAGPTERSRTG